jgi:hypothetical protein
MDDDKRKRLEVKGWKVGSVEEFLALTPTESAFIELKLALANNRRKERGQQLSDAANQSLEKTDD